MELPDLIQRIDTHLKERGISAAEFGKQALNDPAFVYELKNGREPRRKTIDRVIRFLESQRQAA